MTRSRNSLLTGKQVFLFTLLLFAIFIFGCDKNSTKPDDETPPASEITHSEDITQDVTWSSDQIHVVDGLISISNATLTIAPGTVVKFAADARIIIDDNGGLIADGTTAPITLTGVEKQKGYWDKLEFRSGSSDQNCKLINCTIEYGGSNAAIITATGSGLTIKNSIIRYSGTSGIQWDYESTPVFEDNVITGCNETAVEADFESASYLGAGSYTGNNKDYISLNEGTISQNATWVKQDVPYRVTGGANVIEQATLTVEAGTIIQMDADARIIIDDNGGFLADGTDELITITGAQTQKGYWDKFEFRSGSSDQNCKLINCLVEDGGSGNSMIWANGSGLTIENSVIQNSGSMGVYFTNGSTPVFEGNTVTACDETPVTTDFGTASHIGAGTYTGNNYDYIDIEEGDIQQNVTWAKQDVPYRVTGGANSIENGTLIIEPGTVIEMDNAARIIVDTNGGFMADGSSEMITITGAQPQKGFWSLIEIRSGASQQNVVINNCTIEYGGYGNSMISVNQISPTITNNLLQHSAACAIRLFSGANPDLTGNTYSDNDGGNVVQ
ncbi:MAG: right-handed parallel beta-helix repeat-containing protein [Calditrichia bacterium]